MVTDSSIRLASMMIDVPRWHKFREILNGAKNP